jgi:MarR family transcriptional regulator, organic hydroperoxide resistance regulator
MDPLEELRYRVLAIQRDGNRQLATLLRPLGVTPAQGEVLRVLADAESPLTVKQVGELLVCEPGSPSRLVASLVKAGLVSRGAHPDDARASELALTAEGERTAEKVRDVEELLYGVLRARLGSQRTIDDALRFARRLTGDGASAAALNRRLGANEQ